MYWSRTGSELAALSWLVLCLIWWVGGWLICAHAFRLHSRERILAGLGTGMLLFISFSNLFAHFIGLPVALWVGGSLVLVVGLIASWRVGGRIYLERADLRAWPQVLVLAVLLVLFVLINRGLAIFDDYHNLPLISTIAAGDVPPHFYLNTANRMAYHYGLHLFSASMVRLGDLFPWSAFDVGKAISLALAALLGWQWFRRKTRSNIAALLGAGLVLFAGGSRWLLVFIPTGGLERVSSAIQLQGSSAYSGSSLYTNLSLPWLIEGAGPIPFPFAFANGIFTPGIMALGGSGALPLATIFLLLLLARRDWKWGTFLIYSLLLATFGLTAEYLFAPIVAGLFLVIGIGWISSWLSRRKLQGSSSPLVKQKYLRRTAEWAGLAILSTVLVFLSGGLFTEAFRRLVGVLAANTEVTGSGFIGFALRMPPALVSAHLGELSLLDPLQLLVGLAEIGIVIFIAPWVTWWSLTQIRRGNWMIAALGAAALMGFLLPMVLEYTGRDRDITHMSGAAVFLWLILGFPLAWFAVRRGRLWVRILLGISYFILVFDGLVLFAFQILAIQRPQLTTFVLEPDVQLSRTFWNRLDEGAQVLDNLPHRAITLFGRGGGQAYRDFFMPLEAWEDLIANPDPAQIARSGYSYVYFDSEWWTKLTREQRQLYKQPCVRPVEVFVYEGIDTRRLLDVSQCK